MCKEAKLLLTISILFTFGMGLSGIFVNIFFWKQTSSLTVIVIYNLIHHIIVPITFLLAGIVAKKKNGIWSLRIGLFVFALFYILMLLVGSRGITYIYLLGVVFGVAGGFYWLAFNTLSFDFTSINNRDTFNGFNGSCSGIAAAAAPITSAYIISRFVGVRGYNVVFAMTLFMFIVLILVSMTLKCKNYGSKLDFRKIVSNNCKEWSVIRKSTFLWGFRDVIIAVLVNILIIETTKSELSLGKVTFIASLCSSLSFVLVQRIIKPPKRKLSIYIGTLGAFIAVWGLAVKINLTTLLIYAVVNSFFIPFFLIQLSSSTFNVIDRVHEENMRIEYMINREIALNSGRAISAIILLVLLMKFKDTSILKIYLIFISIAPSVSGYFLRKLKRILEGACESDSDNMELS
jgi:YQGE family putative transporter